MSENNNPNIVLEEYSDFRPIYESRYGNSRVFTAQNKGKKVTVKALKESCKNNPNCIAALQAEYDTTSILDHKYLRKTLDFTKIESLGNCIVFEYIEGKSLAEHVRVGTLSEKQVKNILVEICDVLSYMHRNQIVHCNLKPENIIVTADGCHAKLIDIGVPNTDQDADRELLIKEMAFVAPEIIKGEDYDARADIFSLGKIMEFISERNISKQFNAVATHCTQFSKEQRYDSISEVRSAITKGHSVAKIIIAAIVLAVITAAAIIYIPKIKANVAKERAERMAVDFGREIEKIQQELPALCEKYQLKSLNEPIAFNWSDDSLRIAQSLAPFFGSDDYKARSINLLKSQKSQIEARRRADFDRLLLNEFKQATDSVAMQLKEAMAEATEEQWLSEASRWFSQRQ